MLNLNPKSLLVHLCHFTANMVKYHFGYHYNYVYLIGDILMMKALLEVLFTSFIKEECYRIQLVR